MLRELALLLTLFAPAADLQPATDLSFHVVVHRTNPTAAITRAELSAIFMRRTRTWSDRSVIVPIDQPAASRVRERFSRAIHGKSVAYVVRYWQRLIFAGRAIPPPEARGDAAVLEFVRKNPGAIGYVEGAPPSDVKVVAVRP